MNMGLDRALAAGFTPLITPTLVRPEIMRGTGFLGAHSEEIYYLARRRPLPHRHERGRARRLPRRRDPRPLQRAAALRRLVDLLPPRGRVSHGKDTRGIIRVHQFNKLEMFSYVDPADAEAEHERLLALAGGHAAVARPRLPRHRHRGRRPRLERRPQVRRRGVGADAGARTASSPRTSNCTTYQARRLDIRHRTESGQDGAGRDPQRHARHDPVARRDPRDAPAGRRLGAWCPRRCGRYLGGLELLEPVAR